jgi:hypothetical protein
MTIVRQAPSGARQEVLMKKMITGMAFGVWTKPDSVTAFDDFTYRP